MKRIWAAALACFMLICHAQAKAVDADALLTLTVGGAAYRLGESTVEDIAADGWPYTVEGDGTFAFYSPENESYFYARTLSGAAADPVIYLDMMWADGVPVVYCGIPADGDEPSLWDWLAGNFPAETNEDGALIAAVSLPTGDVLQIATTGQRVRLTLTQADE